MHNMVLYLKINRSDYFAFQCIQHWVNIVDELKVDYYFVCDKPDLKKEVLKRIKFKSKKVKFIKSKKWPFRNLIKYIATPNWKNATYAQLTTFLHASKNKIESFYNIDADDTMFVCSPEKVAQILNEAKKYADLNQIKAFSLDMHVSQFRNNHWSFGITYTKTDFDWINKFKQIKDNSWQEYYRKNYCNDFNLDWLMTYLRTIYKNKIETFYVENLLFIHWATLFCLHAGYTVQMTKGGEIYYPLFDYFNADKELGKVSIPNEVVKLDIGLKDEDYQDFGKNNIVNEEHAKNVVRWWNTWK